MSLKGGGWRTVPLASNESVNRQKREYLKKNLVAEIRYMVLRGPPLTFGGTRGRIIAPPSFGHCVACNGRMLRNKREEYALLNKNMLLRSQRQRR
jgi:hypothetical protein